MLYLRAWFSNKANSDYSIFITFNFKQSYVDLIKTLPNRYWDNNKKQWEIPYSDYEILIGKLNNNFIPYNAQDFMDSITRLQEEVQKINKNKEKESNIDLKNVEFKTKPFDYQLDGIDFGLKHDKFLLADEMGTGKSKQSIDISRLKRGGKHCLVICGYKSLLFNWVREIEIHSNEKGYVLGQRLTKRDKKIRSGNLEERLEDIKNLDKIEEFFIITDVTTLRQCKKEEYINKKGKKAYNKIYTYADALEEHCRNGNIGRILIDESHVFKNFENDQTQALLRLKTCPYKIAMTGTPIMNSNLDLYPIMSWLNQENRNYWEFRQHYCKLGGFKGKEVIGDKNSDELHQRLSTFMLRRLKKDVLDLPEKIYIDEYLEMDGKQWALYEKMNKYYKAKLSENKNKNILLEAFITLRKITCHPAWIDPDIKDSVKFERAQQIIFEAANNNQKTIVYSTWTTPFNELNLLSLKEVLKPYNPAMIIGDTKDRMEQVDKFQNDPNCYVMLGTWGSMGVGLTLTAANNVIWLDEPWNQANKGQGDDRTHRPGQKKNVNIYTLMCKDTKDIGVHNTVFKKGRLADKIVDGFSTEELEDIMENY